MFASDYMSYRQTARGSLHLLQSSTPKTIYSMLKIMIRVQLNSAFRDISRQPLHVRLNRLGARARWHPPPSSVHCVHDMDRTHCSGACIVPHKKTCERAARTVTMHTALPGHLGVVRKALPTYCSRHAVSRGPKSRSEHTLESLIFGEKHEF